MTYDEFMHQLENLNEDTDAIDIYTALTQQNMNSSAPITVSGIVLILRDSTRFFPRLAMMHG